MSAKITWGLKHKALRTIYAGAILSLILYGVLVWKEVIKRAYYKAKIGRIQRMINTKIARHIEQFLTRQCALLQDICQYISKYKKQLNYTNCSRQKRLIMTEQWTVGTGYTLPNTFQ